MVVHAGIEQRADHAIVTAMAGAGAVLAMSLPLFPGLTVRFPGLFESD